MIILDTNVVSETKRKKPDPNVMAWLDSQDPMNLYLTSITVAELMRGAHALKDTAQFNRVSDAVAAIIEDDFYGRILSFDLSAAMYYGMRIGELGKNGVAIGMADGFIGAIAISNNLAPVATRDHKPFVALNLDVINPWNFQP